MNIVELKKILEADILFAKDINKKIEKVAASDLMSDVLAFSNPQAVLLTGLTNSQVIRTAEMSDIGIICFVRGKVPEKSVVNLAKEKGIPILVTKLTMYEACGRLYVKGLPGCRPD